jgi:hypothetical protein
VLTKLKNIYAESSRIDFASYLFYIAGGIILLAFVPLIGFPPHVALLGILSIVTGYFLYKQKKQTNWLIAIYFITASVFGLFTVVSSGFGNWAVSGLLIIYVLLTWVFTIYISLLKGTKV